MKLFRRFQVLYAEIKARCYSNVQWNRGVEKKLIPWATVNSAENTGHRSADSISAKVYGINEKRTPYNSIIKKTLNISNTKRSPASFLAGVFFILSFFDSEVFLGSDFAFLTRAISFALSESNISYPLYLICFLLIFCDTLRCSASCLKQHHATNLCCDPW